MRYKYNLHIYPSNFKNESRILKETASLTEARIFGKIWIAATWAPGLNEHESLDDTRQVWRVKLKYTTWNLGLISRILQALEWQIRIFFRFHKEVHVVNCHSLLVLPLGYLFKVFSNTIIIYDTHELESETVGKKRLLRTISKIIEKIFIHTTDYVFTVNQSILDWYQQEYSLNNIISIRNIPNFIRFHDIQQTKYEILRQKFNLYNNEVIFIYLGAMHHGRGIETILNVFSRVQENKHVIFMGYGNLESLIRSYESKYKNIHFHDAVPPNEVLTYTQGADIGICLIENVCLSYYLSLPNKLFEYIMAGIPSITSNFPEMNHIINIFQVGWTIEPEENSLYNFIQNISLDEISTKRTHTLNYRQTIGWHQEEKAMLEAYSKLGLHGIKVFDEATARST
jgi:glycosyltransferase involved in cell wall biosynthesis